MTLDTTIDPEGAVTRCGGCGGLYADYDECPACHPGNPAARLGGGYGAVKAKAMLPGITTEDVYTLVGCNRAACGWKGKVEDLR